MPRQNRVLPDGQIVAIPQKGLLMGNRGCLHDHHGRIVRQHQRKAWITCLVEFKGRKRTLMSPGQYTELFFLDEATALAAGHRPCNECRPERFKAFKEAWLKGNLPGQTKLLASELDATLHQERTAAERASLRDCAQLPTGAMVRDDHGRFYLLEGGRLLPWSPTGYQSVEAMPASPLTLLTPPSTLNALRSGYVPQLHPSATSQ